MTEIILTLIFCVLVARLELILQLESIIIFSKKLKEITQWKRQAKQLEAYLKPFTFLLVWNL